MKDAHVDELEKTALAYGTCIAHQKIRMKPCAAILKATCLNSTFTVTKTVRVSMESVDTLMQRVPNLKVIHLFRDPRAVAKSRLSNKSFKGINTLVNATYEAELYCSRLFEDIKIRRQLEQKYPKRFYQVVYDHFIRDPMANSRKIYDFLGLSMHDDVMQWLRNGHNETRQRATSWRSKMSLAESDDIVRVCEPLFNLMPLIWT